MPYKTLHLLMPSFSVILYFLQLVLVMMIDIAEKLFIWHSLIQQQLFTH